MTHYDRNYVPDSKAAQDAAIADMRAWLGEEHYNRIYAGAENGTIPHRRHLRFYCAFAGVQGYPVEVFADLFHLPEDQAAIDDMNKAKEDAAAQVQAAMESGT